MKRFTHAWIALRAIDRLGKLGDGILQDAQSLACEDRSKAEREIDESKKEKILKMLSENLRCEEDRYDSILYLHNLLKKRENAKLVVYGSWIPDNVISDNRDGHIWKYEPPLVSGDSYVYEKDGKSFSGYKANVGKKKVYYRSDHGKTKSLCFEEAKNAFAWEKPWRKVDGFLADRCEAVHQTVRDMFLYQEDEMHKLAATLIVRFKDELFEDRQKVVAFLDDLDAVKGYYDKKDEAEKEFVNRKEIVDLRNKIGMNEAVNAKIRDCMQEYRPEIKRHIIKSNGLNFTVDKDSFFPMFFNDSQIILGLFSLSHYLSDAHMPLHADSREFSSKECHNVHGKVEEEWENWIIDKSDQKYLIDILSESERAEKFLNICYNENAPIWDDFIYPEDSLLGKFDRELGKAVWEDREIGLLKDRSLWDEMVGATYASYCLSSRLLAFTDNLRAVPKGSREKYAGNFQNRIEEATDDNWKGFFVREGIERIPKKDKLRNQIYEFAVRQAGENPAFDYLSLLILVDSVDCVARTWGKIVKDHLDINCQRA